MSNTGNRFLYGTEFTNITVVANCDNTEDGSIEASGTLFVNTIKEYDILSPGVTLEDSIFASGKAIITSTETSLNISTAALIVYGGISILKDARYYGAFYLHNTVNSYNLNSGSLVVDGGASIFKNLSVGGILNLYNSTSSINSSIGSLISIGGISIRDTTDALSITAGGALTVAGGASIEKTLFANLLNINNATIANSYLINITNNNLYSSNAHIENLTSGNIITNNITTSSLVANYIEGISSSISNLNLTYGTFSNVLILSENVTNSTINNLYTNTANIHTISITQGNIENLTVGTLHVNTNIEYNDIVTNLSTSNILSQYVTIANLLFTYGTFANLYGSDLYTTNLTVPNLSSTYLSTANLSAYNVTSINSTSANSFIINSTIANILSNNINTQNATIANLYNNNLTSTNIQTTNVTSSNIVSVNTSSIYTTTGYLNLTGTLPSFNSSTGTFISYGGISIDIIENATSITNGGGLTVAGGASIAKDVYIGYTLYVPNISSSNVSSIYGTISHLLGTNLNYVNSTFNNLYLTSTTTSTNSSSGAFISFGGVSIDCSKDATSITNGGGLTISGGASIAKSLIVGETLGSSTITTGTIYAIGSSIDNILNTNITSNNGLITNINSANITTSNVLTTNIISSNSTITNSLITNISSSGLHSTEIYFTNLNGTSIYTHSLDANYISNNISLTSLTGSVSNLISTKSTIQNLQLTNGTFSSLIGSYLDVNNASISSLLSTNIFTTNQTSIFNTFGSIYVTSTECSLNSTTASIVVSGGISIKCTENATSYTSGGSITIEGGLAVKKDIYIGGSTWISGNLDLNAHIITNVTSPSNSLDVANKYYVDNLFQQYTTGNVGGNFTQGQVIIATTGGNITGYSEFMYDINQGALYIYSTNDATSVSQGGSLQVSGGASVDKNFYVGGNAHVLGVLDMNNQKITSVAIPTTYYDAANKYYVDNRFNEFTIGNVSGNFTQGQVIVASTEGNITGFESFTFFDKTLNIFTTDEATSLTSGGVLNVQGGARFAKSLYIGGGLNVNGQRITNVTAPSNSLDVVNKWYLDQRFNQYTVGNVSGNFTQGQVIVASTDGNITGFESFTFFDKTLNIFTTDEATSLTSGGVLNVQGGARFAKSLYIGGGLNVNGQRITNVTAPSNSLDVVNKWYLDQRFNQYTVGNVSGNFTQGQVIVASTDGNITGFNSFIFDGTKLSLYATDNASGLTSGGILSVAGGVSIAKDVYIGGKLDVNNNKITNVSLPSNPSDAVNKQYVDFFLGINTGDIKESVFILSNNITVPTDIDGFVFTNTLVSSFESMVYLEIPSLNIYDQWVLNGVLKGDVWAMNEKFVGDYPSRIDFSITNTGQMQYTNTNTTGVATLRFRATTTSQGIYTNITIPNTILNVNEGGTGQTFFSAGTILVGNDKSPVQTYADLKFIGDTLILGNSTNATSLTHGGSLNVTGGVSIKKDVYIGGKLDVNLNNITNVQDPYQDYDAVNKRYVDTRIDNIFNENNEYNYQLDNNVTIPKNIPNFIIPYSTKAFVANVYVNTGNTSSVYTLRGLKGSIWEMTSSFVGGNTSDVEFYIKNNGVDTVIQYTNNAITGLTTISYKMTNLIDDVSSYPQTRVSLSPNIINFQDIPGLLFSNTNTNAIKLIMYISSDIDTKYSLVIVNVILKNNIWELNSYSIGNIDTLKFNIVSLPSHGQIQYTNSSLATDYTIRVKQYIVDNTSSEYTLIANTTVLSNIDNLNTLLGNYANTYFLALVYVYFPSINKYSFYEIEGVTINNIWTVNTRFIGDNTGISFGIITTNIGNYLSYTNPNNFNGYIRLVNANTFEPYVLPVSKGGTSTSYLNEYTILRGNGLNKILGTDDLIYKDNQMTLGPISSIVLNSTQYATNLTSGTLVTYGGVSIQKNLRIGEELVVNNVNITPLTDDISSERTFYANNNQVLAQDVTGFMFSNKTKSFNAIVCVTIETITNSLDSLFEIKGLRKSSGWILNVSYVGDNSGITFSINSLGQIQYTSTNITVWISNIMKFRALTTSM
jgi:hypothetical protein